MDRYRYYSTPVYKDDRWMDRQTDRQTDSGILKKGANLSLGGNLNKNM